MLDTLRGTIGADPLRVPKPARMSESDDAFRVALESADDARVDAEPTPPETTEPVADIDEELSEAHDEAFAEREPTPDADAQDNAHGRHSTNGPLPAQADADQVTTTTISGRESGRRTDAGKGTDSPRTSSRPLEGNDLLDELAAHGARRSSAGSATFASGLHHGPIAAIDSGAQRPGGEPMLRAVDGGNGRATTGATATAVKPAFRTSGAATAQMLEQARESIFKQILLKLADGGGEMRMRLDPPEFGELDLRMVVEHGNRMTLAIQAERPELADLMQRHLGELTQALADAGIQLDQADIAARDADGELDDDLAAFGDNAGSSSDGDAEGEHDQSTGPRGGYIRADGLDYWV